MHSEVSDNHPAFLIIKNKQNDYKINFIYFFIQLYILRWYIGSLIAIPTLIAFFISQYAVPVYKVTSILGNASQYVLKNVSDFAVKIASDSNSKYSSTPLHKQMLHLKSMDDALFAQFTSRLKNPGNISVFLKEKGIYQRELHNYSNRSQLMKIKLMNKLINSFEVYSYSPDRIEFDTSSSNPDQAVKDHVAYIEFTKKQVLDDFKKNTNNEIGFKTQIANLQINEIPTASNEKAGNSSSDTLHKAKQIEPSLNFDASNLHIVIKEGSPFINEVALSGKRKTTLLIGFSIGLMLSLLLVIMKSNIIESTLIDKK